jgi:alcohol dehydrogenase class IV
VLPYVTAHLVDRAPGPLGRIADALGTDDLPGLIWDLVIGSGLPVRLADVGVGPADLDRALEISVTADDHSADADLHPDTHDQNRAGNPAPVTADAVRDVLAAASAGTRPGGPR